ncbi:MAG TPA: lytic transglycosylase domain-containing protein [Solirubrobacteraceae bacterium]|jgi:soluble lytic murein transglycosylase-like protein|nr:lytic transglycosylase domain-containing protein [Solirubrobacteraceae bacterium]
MRLQTPIALVPALLAASLALPAAATATEATQTATTQSAEAPPASTGTTTVPAPPTPEPPPPSATQAEPPPATTTTTEAEPPPAPTAVKQRPQPAASERHHAGTSTTTARKPHAKPGAAQAAPPPVPSSARTPPLPATLGLVSGPGVPSFFIDSFAIPPFLLPIYQAAGAAYGIPWQVLAAINEVETDYGRDLSVSSAGAEGWMQFLPGTWAQYGVDVNRSGFEDPYNPADAIFAAARYLAAAGGAKNVRAAIFAYNHSQAYVSSVLLRARLLGGTPPALLGAITGLSEARFPVYAAAHYSDGFPLSEGASPHQIAATTIYTTPDAPVIAVQDARVVRIASAGPLGESISLRDAYGNTYTYGELGSVTHVYPVLEAPGGAAKTRTSATALSSVPTSLAAASPAAAGATQVFRAGSENVYLHPLRLGAQVIAGTVLGHVASSAEPHMIFQLSPAGASPIDPKPILDGWVKLQSSAAIRPRGRDPFARIAATPGQALLESKTQLEQQLPRDRSVRLPLCERRLIAEGRLDRRAMAALEFISASGLRPTVAARSCRQPTAVGSEALRGASPGVAAVLIAAVNGQPVAGKRGPSTIATVLVHRLAQLQGATRPLQIAAASRFAGAPNSVALAGYRDFVAISYVPLGPAGARVASAGFGASLSPVQWLRLIARLGEVPDPAVSAKPSPAAIPDPSAAPRQGAGG